MLLGDVLKNIDQRYKSIKFKNIRFNSKDCKLNDIFFAINGNHFNGNNFITEAINNGAKIIVSNLKYKGFNKQKVLFLRNKDPRKLLSEAASNFYYNKPKNIIAVTGTNGKTSIANLYYQILTLNKKKVAAIGTLGIVSKKFTQKTDNTSIDSVNIHKILKKLYKLKINNVILEASSHGLKQYRLNNINFNTALFTNFSRDHLDYHKTFSDYLNSKLILFNKLLKKKGNIIFDQKILQAKKLNNISKRRKLKKYDFGNKKCFIKILNIKNINNKRKVDFSIRNKKYSFTTSLIGKIQIKNLFFAILAAYLSKVKMTNILKSIKVDPSFDANNPDKEVVLSWNEAEIPDNPDYRESKYTVYKAMGVDGTSPYFSADSFSVTSDKGLIDYSNGAICDTLNGYYVSNWFYKTKNDSINNQPYCLSRSAYDTIRVKDAIEPLTQLIDFVTVNPQTNELEIYWSEKPSEDIYQINFIQSTPDKPIPFRIIDSVNWYTNPQRLTIPIDSIDVRDTSIWISAQSVDACGKIDSDYANFDFHRNMDLDAVWNQCDSTIDLNWTGYHYFNEGGDEVTYTVYVDSTTGDGNFHEIYSSETTDTTYRHKVYTGDMNFRFYIKATSSENSFASISNIDGDSAYYQDEPLYGYLHYATVTPNKAVEIQMLKDTVVRQGGYSIYRGAEKDLRQMQRIDRVDADGIFKASTFKYTDFTARTDQMAYYYKIITENQCGGNVDTSNFGSSIHLTIDADNEALTNTLKWNEYTEWDSTVAYYNIYRGFNGGEPEDLIAVVAPTDEPMNVYVDDVYDNTNVKGRYCYKVEAVQGPINDDFNGLINSATSVSNEACATQKPLFYVPNAFAPDGINKVFMPKGQFFDFSLYEMAIYNRWGEQIFITRDVTEGWDGTHNGEIVPLGSYVYTIRFKDADGKEHKRKGTVTVIR